MFKPSLTTILLVTTLFISIHKINSTERTIRYVDVDDVNREKNHYTLIDESNKRFKRDSNSSDKVDRLKPSSIKDQNDLNKLLGNMTSLPEFPTDIPEGSNHTKTDSHVYYNVSYINTPGTSDQYWVDMKNVKEGTRHEMLSNAHRRAATVHLSFKFPFYGYKIENITIATGGFLFLGEAVHTWLAATQYIAPLMANFNTSINNSSNIYFLDNKTEFVVQWDNVYLQEVTVNSTSSDASGNKIRNTIEKPFSFQATLKSNGDIIFVYKQIPFEISKINEDKHPVKVGISDAYIIDRTIFFIRRKTIYEYHKAELKNKDILNGTVIYFKALPTCNIYTDCNSCTVHSKTNSSFDCQWCEATKKCSDGYDRHRQEWIKHKCDENGISTCASTSTTDQINKEKTASDFDSTVPSTGGKSVSPIINNNDLNPSGNQQEKFKSKTSTGKEQSKSRKGGFAFVFIIMCLVVMVGYWAMYAYRNPQSRPGQFLIKYRPAQWKFNNNSDQSRYATEFDSIN